jgi:KipI family sensor histidine kinase inhibitor
MLNSIYKPNQYELVNNGEQAITISFDSPTSQQLTHYIVSLSRKIAADLKANNLSNAILEFIPSYQSLTLIFEPVKIKRAQLKDQLNQLLSSPLELIELKPKQLDIPVCYAPQFSPDLDKVSDYCQLENQQIIELHSAPTYWVAMLGFLPGFAYLSGLNQSLHCPRQKIPKLKVAPGSIAIGGSQTGIYSLPSPGGWNVIGRTPLTLFDLALELPFPLSPLDLVKFVAISEDQFNHVYSTPLYGQSKGVYP